MTNCLFLQSRTHPFSRCVWLYYAMAQIPPDEMLAHEHTRKAGWGKKRSRAVTGYKRELAVRPPLPCISVRLEGGVTEEAVPLARNDPGQVETVKHGNYRTWRHVLHLRAPQRQILTRCFLGIYCTMASANRKIQMLLLRPNVPFLFESRKSPHLFWFSKKKISPSYASPSLWAEFLDFLIITFYTSEEKKYMSNLYRFTELLAVHTVASERDLICGVWGIFVQFNTDHAHLRDWMNSWLV